MKILINNELKKKGGFIMQSVVSISFDLYSNGYKQLFKNQKIRKRKK